MHVGDMQDYTHEAEALFARIAERRGLRFEIDQKAPVEVLWRFPKQEQLSVPIVLALQNNDELNFGVADFWSYLFPFPQVGFDTRDVFQSPSLSRQRLEPSTHGGSHHGNL